MSHSLIENENPAIIQSEKSFTNQLENLSKLNKKFNRMSNKISSESVLFTMIKLLVDHRDQIAITDSVLSINAQDLDLVHKLNYCMEYLTNIPFSFQYSKLQSKILLDFLYLKKEMDLITNLEI